MAKLASELAHADEKLGRCGVEGRGEPVNLGDQVDQEVDLRGDSAKEKQDSDRVRFALVIWIGQIGLH